MRAFGLALVAYVSLSSSAVPAQECAGDCSCDRSVTVDEILLITNLALSGGKDGCSCGACPFGGIAVDCALLAIEHALSGCPRPFCLGDCDADGRVTRAEADACVQIAVPALADVLLPECCAGPDGLLAIDEVISIESNVLGGCR